jgi:adenosylhomocysteine nucleosidase
MTLPQINKLLVVALKPEWIHLKQNYSFTRMDDSLILYAIDNNPERALLQIGFGSEQTIRHFNEFLKKYKVHSVLHFGTSGGLSNDLNIGDIFLAHNITDGSSRIETLSEATNSLTDNLQSKSIPTHAGDLFTSGQVLKNKNEKQKASADFSAMAVDMESFHIAKKCKEAGCDYISARGIFDTVNDNLEDIGEPYDKQGNLKASTLAVNILKNPKLIFSLPGLKKRMDLINKNMRPVIEWYLS